MSHPGSRGSKPKPFSKSKPPMRALMRTKKKPRAKSLSAGKRLPPAVGFAPDIYQIVADNVPQNLYCTDLHGRIIFANKQYCKTVGAPLEEIMGKTAHDFFPRKLADKYARDDKRVIKTGRVLDIEEVNKPPTQEPIHVRVVKAPLRDALGKIIGVQGTWWDVSEQRRAAAKLAEQAYFLKTLMEHLPDNIYFKDTQSRFIGASRALVKHVGLADASQVLGKTDFDFFAHEHAEAAFADEKQVMKTGRPIIGKEEKDMMPDGRFTWVSTTKVPLRNNDGKIIGTFGISRNIADRKSAEELLYRRAFFDPLTELPNRALFMNRLSHLFKNFSRHPEKLFAVLFLDIDGFKSINDSLGHETGDAMLAAAARRLESCLRPGDTVARLGGDEFTVLLEDIRDISDAVRVAERITETLPRPIKIAGTELRMTASVGIAISAPGCESPQRILNDADKAMYCAKSNGKNRFEIFRTHGSTLLT